MNSNSTQDKKNDVPRPLHLYVLPFLLLSDSIFKKMKPIAGLEIICIPGLNSATLLYNIMQREFSAFLNLSQRQAVIIHVGTNDIWSTVLKNTSGALLHILHFIHTAGPLPIFSSLLPRVKDFSDTENARRYINDNVLQLLQDHNLNVPVWRTYRNFLQHDLPLDHLYNLTYPRGGQDGIHLNQTGYDVLRQYVCRKLATLSKRLSVDRPTMGTTKIISKWDLLVKTHARHEVCTYNCQS